jgi:hypothetical protein
MRSMSVGQSEVSKAHGPRPERMVACVVRYVCRVTVSWVPVAMARTRAIRRATSLRMRIERLRCCWLLAELR